VQRDWRKHVGEEIAADLRKYRNYRGSSVRDLLRALRNKVRVSKLFWDVLMKTIKL
jgi:Ribonuclease 2-5A